MKNLTKEAKEKDCEAGLRIRDAVIAEASKECYFISHFGFRMDNEPVFNRIKTSRRIKTGYSCKFLILKRDGIYFKGDSAKKAILLEKLAEYNKRFEDIIKINKNK